tara:strand:- start:529 stop:1050 length:522 start_codon:yes stop_codon:yes gene_type:complete
MKFRNYCIVVMGKMGTVKDEIIKIAETKPRYLDATGILMATFASVAEPAELEEFFKKDGRSFFIFDLNKENSAYHLDNLSFNKHLFGDALEREEKVREMSARIMEEISGSTPNINGITEIKGMPKIKIDPKIVVEDLSPREREDLVNEIFDKGVEKMTKSDKKLLKEISNYKP